MRAGRWTAAGRARIAGALASAWLAVAVSSAGAASVPRFALDATWSEVRTPRLVVLTDGGAGLGEDLADRLERFARVLAVLYPQLSTRVSVPLTVVAFRDQTELEAYRPAKTENVVAYFQPSPARQFLVLNGQPEGTSRAAIVFHEFVHAYVAANFPAVPLWLNEGLAEYLGQCRLTSYGAELGHPQRDAVEWFQRGKPLDLSLMFAMTADAPAYRQDNDLRSMFYSQSYVLVHYLSSTREDRARRFGDFLARLQRGTAPIVAFREVFPRDTWNAIVAALPEYAKQMEFEPKRQVRLAGAVETPAPAVRTLPLPEAIARLGEVQLALFEEGDAGAVAHFRLALERDAAQALARSGLGMASARSRRWEEAEAHFERAVHDAPRDPAIWNMAGEGAVERAAHAIETDEPDDVVRAAARLARGRFKKSLELDPDNLHALGGYGQSFAMIGERADSMAVRSLRRAVELQPGRYDLAGSLAILLSQQGGDEEAMALLRTRVQSPGGRSVAAEVHSAMGAAVLQRADSLASHGRSVEAESVLTRALRGGLAPDMQREAERMLGSVQRTRQVSGWVDSVNAATELARGGRLSEAKRALERTQPHVSDPELETYVTDVLRQVDSDLRLEEVQRLMKEGNLAAAERLLVDTTFAWHRPKGEEHRRHALAHVRARRQVDQALALVKAGKLAEARTAFARIAASDVPDEIQKYARERVTQLDAALGKK